MESNPYQLHTIYESFNFREILYQGREGVLSPSLMSNQSAIVTELLELGREEQCLTIQQIIEFLDKRGLENTDIDKICSALQPFGIHIMEDSEFGREEELDKLFEATEEQPIEKDNTYSLSFIQQYFQELRQFKRLTPEEEQILGTAVKAGKRAEQEIKDCAPEEKEQLHKLVKNGEKARTRLIESNLRLVVFIAKAYVRKDHGLLMDAIQDGNVGLYQAAERFDPERGCRFSTYATRWIYQAIFRNSIDVGVPIRIPAYAVMENWKYQKVVTMLTQETGRNPTDKEIAKRMNIDEDRVKIIKGRKIKVVSMDDAAEPDGDGNLEIKDFISDCNSSPEQQVEQSVLRDLLNEQMLRYLTPREKHVLELRFGMAGNASYTLDEIGSELNVTRERVRQIILKAQKKLKDSSGFSAFRDFLEA